MLDEMAPYFVNAQPKSIGNSDLATVTSIALSNLLVALDIEHWTADSGAARLLAGAVENDHV